MGEKHLKVLIAGDFCPINRTEKAILGGNSREMIKGIRPYIEEADVSVINLEAPLTDKGQPILKTGPNLISNPECINFLVESGFNLINTANNHILDYGEEGLKQTLGLLDENNLRYVGSGMNLEEACRSVTMPDEPNGIRFLAFAENEYTVAGRKSAGAAPVDFPINIASIKKAAADGAPVVVLVHGGNEYNPIPSPGMKKRYRGYIDAGASAVVAMHTHCPQGYEIYNSNPIFYSLGNFLFDTPYKDRNYKKEDFWWKGYMVRFDFTGNRVDDFKIIPVDFGPDGTRINEITGAEKEIFINYLNHISEILKNDDEAEKYWKAWCLMKGSWWGDYIGRISYPIDRNDKDSMISALVLRNGMTCEAHNELLTTYWKMVAHGDTKGYEEYIDKIENLQKGVIPK
ncbi:MAG: CapA family protein, partial [Clostridia bacterium]|nr:CapA family protein [Clostridia bacterium]